MLLTEEQRYHNFATTVDACRKDQAQICAFWCLVSTAVLQNHLPWGSACNFPAPSSPGRSESQPGGYVSVRAQELELGTMS